jgi:hypothetical protein
VTLVMALPGEDHALTGNRVVSLGGMVPEIAIP